jgi:hypothetical protein
VYAIDFNINNDGDDGQPVLASAGGVVSVPAYSSASNPLAIDHDGGGWRSGWATLYLHMERTVANGTTVKRGDMIGYVSNVGAPGGNHLHYEQRLDRTVKPAIFNNWAPDYGRAMKQGLGVQVPASDNCTRKRPSVTPLTISERSIALGDFDGDGHDDLAIGVPGEDVGLVKDAGGVNVIYGGGGLDTSRGGSLTQHTSSAGQLSGKVEAGDYLGGGNPATLFR